jgi:regulatory protein
MAEITALRTSQGNRQRVKLFLDGSFAFSLDAEVALKERLKVGQELAESQVKALVQAQNCHCCLGAATRLLSYRPRSAYELEQRLHRRGFDKATIDAALTTLKRQGLVDDRSFATFWKDNRQSFSPRSKWLTKQELKQKGVPAEVIDQVVSTIDDSDSAYRAAKRKTRGLKGSDYDSFRRRLEEFLRRRGFNYRLTATIVERLWREGDRLDRKSI